MKRDILPAMVESLWFQVKTFLNNSFFTNKKGRVKRYAIPIFFAIIVLLTKSALLLLFSKDFSFHIIFIAVILSAWYGGLGPGILATFLVGILDDFLFNPPQFTFDYHSIVSVGVFFIEGILVSILAEAKRQSDIQKDEFIGLASHELKNPLTSIKALATLLQKRLSKTKQNEQSYMAIKIDEQADRATTLINELLDITKIEANKLQFNLTKFQLYDFVKETIKEQQMLTQTHKFLLSGKTKKKVFADKVRLKQVLINLFSNAVKYSPKANKVKIIVQETKHDVIIAVQDFGIGINKTQTKKIFDRFYRTDAALKENIQGLGLGLYISSQIIKKHNGKIWVESDYGKGSTFFISIPVAKYK